METPQEKYKAIIDEINEMHRVDQEMRIESMKGNIEWNNDIDIENTKRLKVIIEEMGYPTISKVGKESSHRFWTLTQHSDHDLDFQKYCLSLMRDNINDVSGIDVAYLEDRVRAHENRPSLYGTQLGFNKDIDSYECLDIEDPENVDKRRVEVGLDTLAEYIEFANQKRKEMKENK